jgi:hypothetical protein
MTAAPDSTEIPAVERFTVSLVLDASTALKELLANTGMKKVDLINRAIQLYNFLDKAQRDGQVIYLRRDTELDRVHII